MSNIARIEGVGTAHEFVEKADYSNPSIPKPTPNGVGEPEQVVSFVEVSCKAARPIERGQSPKPLAPPS